MTDELRAAIASLLSIAPEDVAEFGMWVEAASHLELATLLKAHGFGLYVTVVASHWPEQKKSRKVPEDVPEHLQVATVLRDPSKGQSTTFSWRVKLGMDEEIPSLVSLFAGADWQEREQFDLVGVRFSGHPDLRRLMMPDDWEGHPLRRDYAIDTSHHPWR